jgi:hypothetical protein
MAQKPSMSKSPEQVKSSPSHALQAASAADRDSSLARSPSPTYHHSPEEEARIQQLAHEPAKRDSSQSNTSPGGVKRSDLARIATLSMAKKQAFDQAEQEKAEARKRQIIEEAQSEYSNQQDLDNVARRIVAERLARVTLTGEEGNEDVSSKAAEASINRGNKRVRDWQRVSKSLEDENKSDKERNTEWLRQSMRKSALVEPSKNDPSAIMAVAQRNVKSQLDGMDKQIAEEYMVLGKPMPGESLAKQEPVTKVLEEEGNADLDLRQKGRASIPPFHES